jgi:solute carrier family 34 (sodium-dependent phosphate cotransporter)
MRAPTGAEPQDAPPDDADDAAGADAVRDGAAPPTSHFLRFVDPNRGRGHQAALVVAALALLYVFLVGVGMLSDGFGAMGEGFHEVLLAGVENPLAGLFAGILATIVVQSSSVSTSTVVGLVAAGALPVEYAVPMVMGANLGTTVTNTLAAMANMHRREELQKGFAAATMHDLFNVLAIAIILPLELLTGFLSRAATSVGGWLSDQGVAGADVDGPVEVLTGFAVQLVMSGIEAVTGAEDTTLGITAVVVGIALLFIGLRSVTRIMKVAVGPKLQERVDATVGRGAGVAGLGIGAIAAVLVVSSTIVTVTLVPMVVAGAIAIRNAYPITIGANVGTTATALAASLAAGEPAGLVIALVHVFFNLTAIVLIYPVRAIRELPVCAAEALAHVAMNRRWIVPGYALGLFVMLPAAGTAVLS